MVSLKNKFGVCFFICAIVLACLLIPAELVFSADFSVIDTGGAQKLNPCALNIFPGDTQNKYTASGCSYTTQTRTCCSDGTWSNWDEECKECEEKSPCSSDADCCNGRSCVSTGGLVTFEDSGKRCGIQCSESSKPTCSLAGGTCSYICTCDPSTGEWVNCNKSQFCKAGYETVKLSNGDICCEVKNCGTASAGGFISTCMCISGNGNWSYVTGGYSCNSVSLNNKGKGPDDACGPCSNNNKGANCVTSDPAGEFSCTLYTCYGIKS